MRWLIVAGVLLASLASGTLIQTAIGHSVQRPVQHIWPTLPGAATPPIYQPPAATPPVYQPPAATPPAP